MWILPSRSRPHNLSRFIEAYRLTGSSTPVELCLDIDDHFLRQYMDIKIPSGWNIVMERRSETHCLSVVYNRAYERHPSAKWFGFISDDVVPKTRHWDTQLIEFAGNNKMAYPAGGHEDYVGAPHFILGGDLVRSVGWLSLPGLNRLYIDTVWWDIAKARKSLKFVPNVVLEHRHFSNGGAFYDETYKKSGKDEDRAIYENWRLYGYNQLLQRR